MSSSAILGAVLMVCASVEGRKSSQPVCLFYSPRSLDISHASSSACASLLVSPGVLLPLQLLANPCAKKLPERLGGRTHGRCLRLAQAGREGGRAAVGGCYASGSQPSTAG